MNQTMNPLFQGSLTGEQWAHLGTSVAVWVVAPLAVAHQIVLTELRGADSRGLEEMFLDLTADAAREEVAA
jgi:hypothetical protein